MSVKYNSKKGFTLVELIIVIIMFSIFSVIGMGIIQSTLVSQKKSNDAMKEQISLRQALLAVTREIRMYPQDTDPPGPLDDRYDVLGNNLVRLYDSNSVVAQDIKKTSEPIVSVIDGKAEISITSINNTSVNARISLRTNR